MNDRIEKLENQVNRLTDLLTAVVMTLPWQDKLREIVEMVRGGNAQVLGVEPAAPDQEPRVGVVLNVEAMAEAAHARCLADGDRGYSPFNQPWAELPEEHKAQISRQSRAICDLLVEQAPQIFVGPPCIHDPWDGFDLSAEVSKKVPSQPAAYPQGDVPSVHNGAIAPDEPEAGDTCADIDAAIEAVENQST